MNSLSNLDMLNHYFDDIDPGFELDTQNPNSNTNPKSKKIKVFKNLLFLILTFFRI